MESSLFRYLHFSITTFCFIGFIISFYSFTVELKAERDPSYVAFCDLSHHVSCTRAFTSPYGKGFGIVGKLLGENSKLNLPNSLYGMLFYTIYFFLNMWRSELSAVLMVGMGAVSNGMSVYLAYLLVFVLHDLCLLCLATYFINASLLYLSVRVHHNLRLASRPKQS